MLGDEEIQKKVMRKIYTSTSGKLLEEKLGFERRLMVQAISARIL
jgi:hypothetical protein